MLVAVVAKGNTLIDFSQVKLNQATQQQIVAEVSDILKKPDLILYLLDESNLLADTGVMASFNCPVLAHSVSITLEKLPPKFARINAWPGFLTNSIFETAALDNQKDFWNNIFEHLGLKCRWVPDTPGMVAPRIIAMIINEAYFAMSDGVSNRSDIDTAMKLGTNYPLGPFEWAKKIGLHNIIGLLNTLAATNKKYIPAPLLLNDAANK